MVFAIVAEDNGKIIGYLCGELRNSPYSYRLIFKYAELNKYAC